jgi:hypothetical protein
LSLANMAMDYAAVRSTEEIVSALQAR